MGKKTKKTTWRNLPFEEQQQQCNSSITTISDSEESHSTYSTSTYPQRNQHVHRYHGANATSRWGQRYHHPSRSASNEPKENKEARPTSRYYQQQHSWQGYGSENSNGYRSTSRYDGRHRGGSGAGKEVGDADGSSGKITFNEDEYTRITTPRQDVLFKKGYLNRPRPSLAASSPTSTTDGSGMDSLVTPESNSLLPTPDHILMTPDSPFCYPATGGYIARDGLYFFNGFEPYPVVVYNAAPPQYCYSAAEFPPSSRSKRYSTDSMTESTSPHTEEFSGADGDATLFLPPILNSTEEQTPNATTSIRRNQQLATNNTEQNDSNNPPSGTIEQRKLKKKRRRKLSKPIITKVGESTTTSVSVSSCEEQETSSSDTEEVETETTNLDTQKPLAKEDSPSTCPNSPQSGSSSSASSITTHSSLSTTEELNSSKALSQLKPDAKEFIPRHYNNPSIDFVQNPQFHLIDQHGFIQPAFMSLPIILSPVGLPHHILLPPPPAYNTLNHSPTEQNCVEEQPKEIEPKQLEIQGEEEVQVQMEVKKVVEVVEDVTQIDIIEPKIDSNDSTLNLETPKEVQINSPKSQHQNNLSRDDIREIVSKLEEAAKEQEKIVKNQRSNKNTNRRFNGIQKDVQYVPKDRFKSPIQGNNRTAYASSNNQIRTPKNVVPTQITSSSPQHQSKPYSNLFKQSQISHNQLGKVFQKNKPVTFTKIQPQSNSKKPNTTNSSPVTNRPIPGGPNQWINVSNRKKRRSNNANQNIEEDLQQSHSMENLTSSIELDNSPTEYLKSNTEVVQMNLDDGFEKYDVNTLVDVVVQEIKEIEVQNQEDVQIEQEFTIESVKEVQEVIQEVSTIKEEVIPEILSNLIKENSIEKEPKQTRLQNKKTNNKNPKQIKRVMVTDNIPPVIIKETPIKKVLETKKLDESKPPQPQEKADVVPKKVVSESTPSKTSKKTNKKKSTSKSNCIEVSPSISKEDVCSYNFLPANSEDKTNVEVSQELDLLIQRGMYSSLEEKIRNFNITASNDGFFKTINYYGTGKLVNTENSLGNKDLNGILKDLKPAMNSKLEFCMPKDISQIITKQSTNNGYQDFLGPGPDLHEPDKTDETSSTNEKDNNLYERDISPGVASSSETEESYPITRAVKEWMTKTREHTPEIELLKSPMTILKQFASSGVEAVEDDELTLWTLSNQDSVETDQDLLDCWETEEEIVISRQAKIDDLMVEGNEFVEVDLKVSNNNGEVSQGNQEVMEDGLEVLEVYESRYGKNEDFVRIRDEWEERARTTTAENNSRKQNRNVIPPTASLPYRAICCAIM